VKNMPKINQIQKNIMRRVYYAYTLRIVLHPLVIHAALFAVAIYGLSVVLHVASIIKNLRAIPVGNLDTYIYNAFMNAEFFTFVFIGIGIMTLLSLRMTLKMPKWHSNNMQVA